MSCNLPSNPMKYLRDFCEKREGDEDQPFRLLSRSGGLCEDIVLTKADMRIKDTELHDCWAKEYADVNGTPIEWFVLDMQKSPRDDIYDEVLHRYAGPFKFKGVIEKPTRSAIPDETGISAFFDTKVWIARKCVEDECMGVPKIGDIVQLWDLPFYADWASLNSKGVRNAAYAFDVVDVQEDGHPFDGPFFVGFDVSLQRNTKFSPERKIYGDGPQRTV